MDNDDIDDVQCEIADLALSEDDEVNTCKDTDSLDENKNERPKFEKKFRLIFACHKGRRNVVIALLKKGEDPNEQSKAGMTPLMVTAEHGHDVVTHVLLNARASVAMVDDDEETALMKACDKGHESIVEALLTHGDVPAEEHVNHIDATHRSALIKAAAGGHLDIVMLLLGAGADLHAIDAAGDSALSEAAFYGHAEVVKALLDAEADADARAAASLTALQEAAQMGRSAVLDSLLERVNHSWALRQVISRGDRAAMKALLTAGADAAEADEDGRTPLMLECACEPPLLVIVQALLDAGGGVGILKRGPAGLTAREIAVQSGASQEVLDALETAESALEANKQ